MAHKMKRSVFEIPCPYENLDDEAAIQWIVENCDMPESPAREMINIMRHDSTGCLEELE